jgi:hypothetical protein
LSPSPHHELWIAHRWASIHHSITAQLAHTRQTYQQGTKLTARGVETQRQIIATLRGTTMKLSLVLGLTLLATTPAFHTLAAGVGPITDNSIPSWATSADVCTPARQCDDCSALSDSTGVSAYCRYDTLGQASCCLPAAAAAPVGKQPKAQTTQQIPSRYLAHISSIQQNPIPLWASPSDTCTPTRQCEDCSTGSDAGVADSNNRSYCKWSQEGQSMCCTSSMLGIYEPNIEQHDQQHTKLVASVSSSIDTYIPSWADLSHDICVSKRSCDLCIDGVQYCLYDKEGRSKCCSTAPNSAPAAAVQQQPEPVLRVAGVNSAIDGMLPEWAKPEIDLCLVVNTCDNCRVGAHTYCHYTLDARAHCCVQSPIL